MIVPRACTVGTVLVFLLLGMTTGYGLADSLQQQLASLEDSCFSEGNTEFTIRFAPVVERRYLNERERDLRLRWGAYQFTSANKGYANRALNWSEGRSPQEIWLIRDIKFQNPDQLPAYIWHVISVPRRPDDDPKADATLVHAQRVPDSLPLIPYSRNTLQPRLTQERLQWHKTHSFVPYVDSHGRKYRLPTFNMGKDIEKKNMVTGIWQTLLGVDIVKDWLLVMNDIKDVKGEILYLHTFYFWPINKSKAYGPHALKEASTKLLQAPGRVFGFILDPLGACLAFDYVDVK
ncbi:MAG: hypothetical protein IH878_04275 [Gemmatimonadetes bacterium]|nr:hypothetical protein [Gemmatimonadota bacterium]